MGLGHNEHLQGKLRGVHESGSIPLSTCPSISGSPAHNALDAAEADSRGTVPGGHAELWDWLQNQDMPMLLALLAMCIMRCANAGGADWTEGQAAGCVAAEVVQAAGLDMQTWWQPTVESYLGRVPRH